VAAVDAGVWLAIKVIPAVEALYQSYWMRCITVVSNAETVSVAPHWDRCR
jgi:hypothetical protein